tara:strand:+ start:227 stop:592 length:366 start_codon:yes stop_codon:yes gene_type:complete
MNNVTYLHTIYVDYEARAVFDGSIQGMKKALASIDARKSFSDLDMPMFGEAVADTEVGDYLEDMGGCWGEYTSQDEYGVYISLEPMQLEMEIYPEIDLESKEWKNRLIPGQCLNSWFGRTA